MAMHSESNPVGRRTALRLLAGGLAVGAGSNVALAQPGSDEFVRQLNTVRTGTQRYRDVAVALDDGYVPVLGYVPGMGFHLVRGDLIADEHGSGPVDGLENPPILVYFTTGDYNPSPGEPFEADRMEDMRLGGVEFAYVGDDGPDDYFADESSSRKLLTTEEDGWEFVPPAGVTAIHVWVHRNNPKGVFHPTNPTID